LGGPGGEAGGAVALRRAQLPALDPAMVGRCMLTGSKPGLNAPTVSALETEM